MTHRRDIWIITSQMILIRNFAKMLLEFTKLKILIFVTSVRAESKIVKNMIDYFSCQNLDFGLSIQPLCPTHIFEVSLLAVEHDVRNL